MRAGAGRDGRARSPCEYLHGRRLVEAGEASTRRARRGPERGGAADGSRSRSSDGSHFVRKEIDSLEKMKKRNMFMFLGDLFCPDLRGTLKSFSVEPENAFSGSTCPGSTRDALTRST